jgi:SAM-dependent methyltransferase
MTDEQAGLRSERPQDGFGSAPRRPWPGFAWVANFRALPDAAEARLRYRKLAARYEDSTWRIQAVRELAVAQLNLRPGQTVFDVACGCGATLPALSEAVGPTGRVIAIEQSPEMAAMARRAAAGTSNIEVICEPVERLYAPMPADAVLFCYTHDVLQDAPALDHLFAQVRPGARVALSGLCMAPWWLAPANIWVLWGARLYLTTWRGLRRPWRGLLRHCPDLLVTSRHHWQTGYVAAGHHDRLGSVPPLRT